ncbi:hypothetical protein BVL54_19800 [Bacillus paralicheniformis]|nr:hypothetical protein BVL54_19800 [Bacillus paralicheniformis]
MKKFLLVVGATAGAFLLLALMVLLEVSLHLALSFLIISGADLITHWFGASLVPEGQKALFVGIGAAVSYILARIGKIINK